jgi:large subunit ribosomal protein L9
MKIILLKDVPKVGRRLDVKDVAEGFALNMLIPRGLAEIANVGSIKKIEQMRAKDLAEKKVQEDLLVKNLDLIKQTTITIKEKANDKGHLFAGVTKEMLANEIKKTARINIDPESIQLSKPIKEVGEHKITVAALDKKTEFTLIIESL